MGDGFNTEPEPSLGSACGCSGQNRVFDIGLRQLLADHLVAPRVPEAGEC